MCSLPAEQHFPNQTQFLRNDATRNTGPRQLAADASPSFQRQQNFQAPGEASRLSLDEQKKALNKLKKEIYNPMGKWLTRKPNLYYRDDPDAIARETEKNKDEDGKRCAICLEDFEPKEMVVITPCNHMFHEECIIPWLQSQGQCPVCRFVICEKSAVRSSNTTANDPFQSDLIAIIAAMEEAFVPQNMRRIL